MEAATLDEIRTILKSGKGIVDRILLDNMVKVPSKGKVDTSMLAEAVKLINGAFLTEASGNVTLETVGAISKTGVDYISSGALTHSVIALDISLKINNLTQQSKL